jgi:hypothetical protein
MDEGNPFIDQHPGPPAFFGGLMMHFGDDFGVRAAFSGFNAVWCSAFSGLLLSGILAFVVAVLIALLLTLALTPIVCVLVGV